MSCLSAILCFDSTIGADLAEIVLFGYFNSLCQFHSVVDDCVHACWEAAGYEPTDTVGSVFTVPSDYGLAGDTLLTALAYKGGKNTIGAARILLRAAVAAILNAANSEVNYPLAEAGVLGAVNLALSSHDRDTMLDLANELDTYNNLGCALLVSRRPYFFHK
jgi:hypothetical protein